MNIKEELEKKGHSYYLPSLFSNLKLLSPLNNVSISEPSVDLVWQGNANRYKLFLSTDPDFKNCEPIEIVNDQITSANNRNASFILFGLVPALVITCKRRKRLILLSIMVPFCFNFTSCDNKNSMDETLKYTHSVPNLEKNKTYYWKIETIRDDYILSSSITKKFKTDN